MKPRGTNNAAENELTTPEAAFGKAISQCGLSTGPLKPSGTTTLEKTPFQRAPHQRTNQPLKRYQFWIFTTLVNPEIESQYDNLKFELLPLDLAI
ncbi:hypothetical protein NB499_19175 [Vibrio alginolyticus]|nr:hypothetical protein [Vibrio alginolyticus]MCR9615367.1 hypothetical protein [Vibrio alginolyticus]